MDGGGSLQADTKASLDQSWNTYICMYFREASVSDLIYGIISSIIDFMQMVMGYTICQTSERERGGGDFIEGKNLRWWISLR